MLNAINNNTGRAVEYRQRHSNWTSIRLLNIYRLGLSALFFSQSFVQHSPLLNINDLGLYSWVAFAFLILSLVWMLAAWIERRGFQHQISLQLYTDTIIIILLMHACGGINSGLGMLLIISIVVAGLLAEHSLAIIFASMASIGLLAQHIYSTINISGYSGTSTQVGLLGATLFATAIVTHRLTTRLHSSENLVRQRERDVALLSALNQEIIENLQAGVIVLNRYNKVRHINKSALQMLGMTGDDNAFLLRDHPKLLAALKTWHESLHEDRTLLPGETGIGNIQINFRQLQSHDQENTLIFLNDVSSIKSSMQQAKLASLGHLTASIAHEIRNPLGAISHAAELLAENQDLPRPEKRLTEIIHQHTGRINHIIEDILNISRGRPTEMGAIALDTWLQDFIEDFCLGDELNTDCFNLNLEQKGSVIYFDRGHLAQIMTNLCSNARIHGAADKTLHIDVYSDNEQELVIELADEGPGIEQQKLDKIFEPFYTTSHQGSGLGLYIVNQLCELNNATIAARKNSYNGTSFVIRPSTSALDLIRI